jgi:hypothetical protein
MNRSLLIALPLGVISLACGSRGPLDLEPPLDAGGPDAVVVVEAGTDAGTKPPDAGPSVIDELFGCGLCVTQKCGSKVQRCLGDQDCNRVLQCVLQKCVLSGLDLGCVNQCTSDPQAALKAFEILQCITGVCGAACGGGFTPLGGLGIGN